jgi:hypothetical protein
VNDGLLTVLKLIYVFVLLKGKNSPEPMKVEASFCCCVSLLP